jgi:hypothetical protein
MPMGLAERAAVLAVHHHVGLGVAEPGHIGEVAAEGEGQVHLSADALDEPPHLGQVGPRVEVAVARPDDVHARLGARGARARGARLLRAVLVVEPEHRPVGALPLVFIDGAGQKTLNVGAFGGDAAADHLGDRAGHYDAGQGRVECPVRAPHRPLGALPPELFFGQAGDHDGQLVRRQPVGVVQHRGDRQVLAADRAVDDDLQPLHGREHVDGAPIAAGAVVVEDQHPTGSSALGRRES